MGIESTEKLINDLIERRKVFLQQKIQRYPVNQFRASDIHECDRYMVHSILDWDKRSLHDEGLQAIFDRGNEEEKIVVRDIMALGFQFVHQQTPFEIKDRNSEVICRGRIDGKILYEKKAIPVEIKSMNLNTFNTIKSLEDFQKRPILRKYCRQMQLYLYGNNEESGLFVLSDLQGHYKLIPIILDYGECDLILKRLESNWIFKKNKSYPNPIDYNESICGRCPFAHLCLPAVKNKGAEFIDNPELEEKLNRREELKTVKEEYESIDEEIKAAFKGIPQAFVGTTWQIMGKERIINRLDSKNLPEELRKQYTTQTTSWITHIIKLNGEKK